MQKIKTISFFMMSPPNDQIGKAANITLNGKYAGAYRTDKNGLIYVPLEPGWYVVTEKKADGRYALAMA